MPRPLPQRGNGAVTRSRRRYGPQLPCETQCPGHPHPRAYLTTAANSDDIPNMCNIVLKSFFAAVYLRICLYSFMLQCIYPFHPLVRFPRTAAPTSPWSTITSLVIGVPTTARGIRYVYYAQEVAILRNPRKLVKRV
jgi:hypothetical protein